MQDNERKPESDDEPYDLDDETPYDLDDEAPYDRDRDREGLLDLTEEAPPEIADELVIDLDEGESPEASPAQPVSAPPGARADATPSSPALGGKVDRRSLSDEKERERAIAEVLRDQARREVLRDVVYRSSGASLRLRIVAGALVAAALLVWFLPVPGFRASVPFPLAPETEAAGLRLATWVQAQQVEAFRQTRGRLPDVLREAGEALPGMTYERIDAQTYRLSGATERIAFTWTSTDSLDATTRQTVARLRGQP